MRLRIGKYYNNRKAKALELAKSCRSEWCKTLAAGETWSPPEVQGILFYGVGKIEQYHGYRYLQNSRTFLPTRLCKNMGRSRKAMYFIAKSLIREMESEHPDKYIIERDQLRSWYRLLAAGEFRASFNSDAWFSKLLMRSPNFSRYNWKGWSHKPKLPKITYIRDLRNTHIASKKANVGAPFYRKWNKGDADDEKFHHWIWSLAESVQKTLTSASMSDLMKWINVYKRIYYSLAGARVPDRLMIMISKVLNFILMRLVQRILDHMKRYDWVNIGSLGRRKDKFKILSNKQPGSFTNESDDLVVKSIDENGREGYVSCDDSAFDLGMNEASIMMSTSVMAQCIPPEFRQLLYNLIWIMYHLPTLTPLGMMISTPFYGLLSGGADTKVRGCILQAMRAIACRRLWRSSYQEGIRGMNFFGEFHKDKQLWSHHTATLCQLVWDDREPDQIHSILARTARNLVELEGYTNEELPADAALVQGIYALADHPKFLDFVQQVREYWDVRKPSDELLSLIKSKYDSNTCGYEMKKIKETIQALKAK